MKSLVFDLHAVGVLAPGLNALAQLREACHGDRTIQPEPLVLPPPSQLPAAERRRSSQAVRLALACIAQALETCPFDPAELRPVFATDEGTGEICQQMLEALATTRQVSPLVFTNSVHNAPSGYFSIGWHNRQPATVVSLGLESFASGLLCAVTDTVATGQPVLLVVCDPAMTAPLDELLPVVHATAVAMVLSAAGGGFDRGLGSRLRGNDEGLRRDDEGLLGPAPLGRFQLALQPMGEDQPSALPAWLPAAWSGNSSVRALAALGLLEQPAGTVQRFSLNGQLLALSREEQRA